MYRSNPENVCAAVYHANHAVPTRYDKMNELDLTDINELDLTDMNELDLTDQENACPERSTVVDHGMVMGSDFVGCNFVFSLYEPSVFLARRELCFASCESACGPWTLPKWKRCDCFAT